MSQRKGPSVGSPWRDAAPEEPGPKDRRAARGVLLLTAALALSLLLNAALLALRFQAPAPTPASGGGGSAGAQASWSLGGQLAGPEWTHEERQRMLQRAEAVFQLHTGLKDELMGTKEEPTHPFSAAVEGAMFAAHQNWGQGDPTWLSVFSKEYLSIPRYPCFEEVRLGTWGDGGKWLCLTPLHKPKQDLVIYSIGSRGDTSFEKAAHALLGPRPHCFDPFVPDAAELEALPYLHFHAYGLGARGQDAGGAPAKFKDLRSIMQELGHSFVDVLKVDCEGCETAFVKDIFETTSRDQPLFGQLQLEIHRLSNLTLTSQLLSRLVFRGFRLFHTEANFFEPGDVLELAFIHESRVHPGRHPGGPP